MEKADVIEKVRSFLEYAGHRYDYDPKEENIKTKIGLNCSLLSADVFINFQDSGYNVWALSPTVPRGTRIDEMRVFLSMANYCQPMGNFDVDHESGIISFKCWVSTWWLEKLPRDAIAESLYTPTIKLEQYGDSIQAIALGLSDAENEIKNVEANSMNKMNFNK